MRENLLAILNKIKDEVIAVPVKVSSKTQSLYDAARYAWNVNKDNRDKINYVIGIDNKIAKIIIKITNRIEVTENTLKPNGEIETDKNRIGRIYFEGEENPNENGLDLILGQDVTDFFGSMNSAIKYPKIISGSRDVKGTGLNMDLLNQILYGPPGIGKTYNTVIEALKIIEPEIIKQFQADGETYDDYKNKLLPEYNKLKKSGQIEFVTFHQSYGYEEFVEGIKPIPKGKKGNENNSEMIYDVVDGVFKRICKLSQEKYFSIIEDFINEEISTENSSIWKISLGGTGVHQVKTKCFENSEIRIGWNYVKAIDDVEFNKLGTSNQGSIRNFIADMKIGDFVVSIASVNEIDGIGIILSDASQDDDKDYNKVRKVKWLLSNKKINLMSLTRGVAFTQKAVYKLERVKLKDLLQLLPQDINSLKLKYDNAKKDFVLIIDEINRGNISKNFGELITLIEGSKRDVMTVTLPYSGESFSVPNNLYIIGTMNTADRSIALMDTALRRRFEFVEMQPKPQLLSENVDGVNLKELLETINQRIEYLYDRDHTIGHAYFMGITDFAGLCNVFANKIIPLLQEYFYDDWEKIRLVLADNQVDELEYQFIQTNRTTATSLFGTTTNDLVEADKIIYTINKALKPTEKDPQQIDIKAFTKIYDNKVLKQINKPASTETSQDQGS